MTLRPLLAATLLLAALPAAATQWTLTDAMPIAGNSTDRIQSAKPAANINRQGFFSDLTFEPATRTWFALSDRGPGGGVIGYATRVQQMLIPTHPFTGELLTRPIVLRTILFTDRDGQPFNGLNPKLLNGSANTLGRSFDPEGFAIGRNGHFFVADEYGPSLYEFDRRGRFLRAFDIPQNLRPRQADGQDNFSDGRPIIVRGRQDNRGFEGLTLNASGTRLYAVMQDPLVDEGSGGDGRRSRWVRIVEFDVRSGTSLAQYAYPLETIAALNAIDPATADDFSATNQGRSIGLSAITALSDHEFLVLERDNRGLGVEVTANPLHKRVYRIDLRGASDIRDVSLAGSNDLPSGIVPVAKEPEVDLLAALRSVGSDIPEKLEGLAIGPRLWSGARVVLIGSDNDYSVTQTGAGEQFDVCVSPDALTRQQVPLDSGCPAGTALIPGWLFSFRVR
jgi:hypothetical protein